MEFVFVVPRRELFPESYPYGLTLFGEGLSIESFMDPVERSGFFVEREVAERNPEWKQVIPYTIVERDGLVLLLRRTSRGGEARLHNKLSIGVGGHINPIDLQEAAPSTNRRNPIHNATIREVCKEELRMDSPVDVRPVGTLNDDSNPVGAVHVGFVQVMSVQGPVEVHETDQLEGDFVTPAELVQLDDQGANFETWSRLLIPHLTDILPNLVAS